MEFAEAFNHRDLDALCAACTEDVEFWTYLAGRTIPAEPFRGYDGIAKWIGGEAEAFSEAEVRGIEARELGPDLVLGAASVRGIGRESGIEVSDRAAWLFQMRGGKIARWRAYPDEVAAERAAPAWRAEVAEPSPPA